MEPKSSNLAPLPEENQDQKEDRVQSDHAPTTAPSAFSSKPIRPPTQTSSQKYSPLDWKGYFDQEDDVCIPDTTDVFHIYTAGKEGPVVFCLHGGGYSGLSFAISARLIKDKARVVAMDLRGHGKSSTENETDMSIETLCSDVLAVLKRMYGDTPPAIVLVGHSMGGSVAVHVAAKKTLRSLAGLVVVDVVEGTAMASLMHMQKILSNRMQYFSTLEKAVYQRAIAIQFIALPTIINHDLKEDPGEPQKKRTEEHIITLRLRGRLPKSYPVSAYWQELPFSLNLPDNILVH